MMAAKPGVILYSTTQHTWEVWKNGAPVAHGSLESCQAAYPKAMPPTEQQYRLAAKDAERDHA